MTRLSISLLGPLQVELEGKLITGFATDKARALLAYLAVESDRLHRRDALAGLLWPEQPQQKARQSLRQALSHLRQAIATDDDSPPFLLVTREAIRFNPDFDYWLDVEIFERLVNTCKTHRHRSLETCLPCMRRLEQIVALYQGDLLDQFSLRDSGPFEEWATLKREWLRRETGEAFAHLASYFERRGEYETAQQYARRRVNLEPWQEETHRQLMRLLALDGQRSAALAQYERCRRVLAEEFGVEPTAETQALDKRITEEGTEKRGGGGTGQWGGRTTKIGAVSQALYNIPPSPTPFVGREQELTELAEMLANPDCQLITLLGPGGIGKTCLALQVAADHRGTFTDGIALVPLASVERADLIAPTIADTIGLDFQSGQDACEQLLSYLREKNLLLIVDNLEHLLDSGGADLLAQILQRARSTVILVTSRERLNLREEWVYDVRGLETRGAVTLFGQTARRVRHRFAVSKAEMPHVVRICQAMEGMPLGIELAAAWVNAYSCAEIAEQVERSLDLMATSWRNMPARHRSLRAAFEHSWRLLSEPERAAFRRLSVFRGGFQIAAAERVSGASVSTLTALVDKSLLLRGPDGAFQVHQLLRQYAAERLAQDPQEQRATTALHGDTYATFLQEWEDGLKSGQQKEALGAIGAEIDNVRHAWQWAVQQMSTGDHSQEATRILQRAAPSLYLFYATRDWHQEGEEAFRRAVEALDRPDAAGLASSEEGQRLLGQLLAYQGKCCEFTDHSDKAQALFTRSLTILRRLGTRADLALPLHGLGYMAHIKGEYGRAEQHLLESLDIYKREGDSWGIASALNNLCLVARRRGTFEDAKQHAEASLSIRRTIGDRRAIAASLSNLGLIHCDLGEYAEARKVLDEALQICRQLDYKIGIANAATGLCQAAFRLGNVRAAEIYGRESLDVYRDVGDYWGVAIALNNLGRMAAEMGNHVEAKRLYLEGIAIYREIGIKSGLANTLGNLGEACCEMDAYKEAEQHLREALEIAWEIGALPAALKALVVFVRVLALQGEIEQGLELLAFCTHQSAISKDMEKQAAAVAEQLAQELPEQSVAAAEAHGQARALADVVAEVLHSEGTQ